MKEIMVIKDEQAIDEWNRTIAQFIDVDNKIYKAEFIKEPETFEELKKLCKGKDISAENEEIIIRSHDDTWLTFREQDGEVFLESETGLSILLGYKRTSQQMWQIIKSLIGEE